MILNFWKKVCSADVVLKNCVSLVYLKYFVMKSDKKMLKELEDLMKIAIEFLLKSSKTT